MPLLTMHIQFHFLEGCVLTWKRNTILFHFYKGLSEYREIEVFKFQTHLNLLPERILGFIYEFNKLLYSHMPQFVRWSFRLFRQNGQTEADDCN